MKRLGAITVAALAALVVASGVAASSSAYRAFVDAPPKVQRAGATYVLKIRVRNLGPTVRPFCVDFTDDNDSWLIEMPGLYSFKSDAWCAGTLRRGATKTLRAFVTAARPGSRRMSITIGKATVFRSIRKIVIDDDDALVWESRFVIVG